MSKEWPPEPVANVMADKSIVIHQDTLTYTSEGLSTAEGIELTVGAHNRIVVKRPKKVEALGVGYGTFGLDSSFPTPGVLMLGLRPALDDLFGWLNPDSAPLYQVYGHAEPSGDDAHNKALSDRRATVVHALLAADIETLAEIAQSEGWGPKEHQTMLRVLRCDPGAIDGEPGELTAEAAAMFQREYLEHVFHAHAERDLAYPDLPTDGKLEGTTLDALLEAFVLAVSPRVQPEEFHPTHPTVGCSEFNLVDPDGGPLNRRVSLIVHQTLPPHHDRAPCELGDHSVCPLDDNPSGRRCLWYREHVIDPPPSDLVHRHFDLRWLSLTNGKLLLSALTTLPEEHEVSFQVFRSEPASSPAELTMDNLGAPVSEVLTGLIRNGVAQVVWEPPQDFSITDVRTWMVPIPAREAHTARQTSRIPLFVVRGGGVEALSPPPGRELRRVPTRPANVDEPAPAGVLGMDAFGKLHRRSAVDERERPDLRPLRDDEPRMVRVRFIDEFIEREVQE